MTNDSKNILQRGLEYMRDPFSSFVRAQTTSSLFLLLSTIVALWWANSVYSSTYLNLVHTPIGLFLGDFELRASLKYIINDGLIVIFLLLGLEIPGEDNHVVNVRDINWIGMFHGFHLTGFPTSSRWLRRR